MIITVYGAAGSMGTRHARNLLKAGHTVRCYDVRRPESDLIPYMTPNLDPFGPDVDAVVIATPTKSHAAMLNSCILHRKHAFVEKPMTLSRTFEQVHEAGEIVKDFLNKGLVLCCGYNLRFHPRVRNALRQNIGNVRWASFVLSQYSGRTDYREDSVIDNWMTHEIDLAQYLIGPLTFDHAHRHSNLNVDAFFRSEHGMVHVHGDYIGKPAEVRFAMIIGETARLNLDLLDPRVGEQDYYDEIVAFTHAIQGKGAPIICTGSGALATVNLCHQIHGALEL